MARIDDLERILCLENVRQAVKHGPELRHFFFRKALGHANRISLEARRAIFSKWNKNRGRSGLKQLPDDFDIRKCG